MLALLDGPGTGTMGGSSSLYSTDSLLSRFTAILVENGQSWLQASVLLDDMRKQLEEIQLWISWKEGVAESSTDEAEDAKRQKYESTEEVDSDED